MNTEYDKTDKRSEMRVASNNEGKGISKKAMLIIVGVAVVLLVIVWIWKGIEINNERQKAEQDQQALRTQARTMVTNTNKEHLKLLAKPYVWAIRTELLKGNISQVNTYANEMVKERNFQNIVVADDKGKIISSTNKKDEGKEFTTVGNAAYLNSDNTMVESLNDSIIVMSSPIMGFNNRLGTLMITYKARNPI
jgi:sensor histidine kinase regulating citrate/malate metabolism